MCVRVCERGRHSHTIAACVLQTHTSIITVSVTWLCSHLGLELMVQLRTLLTIYTFILKAKPRDYGKRHYISDSCLWCSANHYAMCQLANQSRLRLSEGGVIYSNNIQQWLVTIIIIYSSGRQHRQHKTGPPAIISGPLRQPYYFDSDWFWTRSVMTETVTH